jgi:hypothetical protein
VTDPGPRDPRQDWEAHRAAQEAAWRRSTPEQRLRWLEAAIALAYEAGVHPSQRRRTGPADPARGG